MQFLTRKCIKDNFQPKENYNYIKTELDKKRQQLSKEGITQEEIEDIMVSFLKELKNKVSPKILSQEKESLPIRIFRFVSE